MREWFSTFLSVAWIVAVCLVVSYSGLFVISLFVDTPSKEPVMTCTTANDAKITLVRKGDRFVVTGGDLGRCVVGE